MGYRCVKSDAASLLRRSFQVYNLIIEQYNFKDYFILNEKKDW